jgi:hypothetical protein
MPDCTYNNNGACRTLAINISPYAGCTTCNYGKTKAGLTDINAGVGGYLADCKLNNQLECQVPNVTVVSHGNHADCGTVQFRRRLW